MSKTMGHSSLKTTADLYSHLIGGVGAEVAERSRAQVPRTVGVSRRDQSVTSSGDDEASAGDR